MDLSRGIAYGRHAGLEKYYMYVFSIFIFLFKFYVYANSSTKNFIWTRVANFNPSIQMTLSAATK